MFEYDSEKLEELLENRRYRELSAELREMHEVDIAQFISELSPEQARIAFRVLPKQMSADVFSELDSDMQQIIIESATDSELSLIIEDLGVDDAVDMIEELPANVVKRVLKTARPDTRALINQFLKYPENSAGSIMTAEFTDLHRDMTVAQAIDHIRKSGEDRETVYTCYVIDQKRVLLGVVTVKDLLLSPDDAQVGDIMEDGVISVTTSDDRETAAQVLSNYGFLALPVVDNENRLVGVITVDDAMDVIEQEVTEDFEVMSGIHPSERPYFKTSVFSMFKNRIVWLLVLMVSGMITGGILSKFNAAISAMPMLVTFIPMLTDTGGNSGSQSSTMVIRSLATGDIELADVLRVMWKEFRVSLLVGLSLSIINFIRIMIFYPGNYAVAFTVSITLYAVVILAKLLGSTLPMLAKAIHLDPAIMASPLITTLVDACALLLYFFIATRLLPI